MFMMGSPGALAPSFNIYHLPLTTKISHDAISPIYFLACLLFWSEGSWQQE